MIPRDRVSGVFDKVVIVSVKILLASPVTVFYEKTSQDN